MPLVMKSKNTDTATDQSMHFWGVCCESGKQYAQVVGQRFRITMAVLDPKSFSKEESEKTVLLIVIRGGIEYLLCVLKHEEIHQVNLNLIFDKGENVVFYINGHGKVYLSGYQLTDSESDVINDENGYLCPLVEVKSTKSKTERRGKVPNVQQDLQSELVTPKSKKKAKANKDVSQQINSSIWAAFFKDKNGELLTFDDDDDDESDEDFSLGDEDTESDDDDSSEDYTDESVEQIEDEELADEEEEEEEEEEQQREEILDSKDAAKKRKLSKLLQPEKHSRKESLTLPSTLEKSKEVICLEDDKDSSDSDVANSSIGHTPMPKKRIRFDDSAEKKKSKKKKRLSEESNTSNKQLKDNLKSPIAGSTPGKSPVQKVNGGVEIQDVIIGKGPVATKGKMVHVFYVGQFQDKTVFDSRVPGKKPFSFKLGAQQVIKGWDVGLQGMRVGGKRKLKIPPHMGYGNSKVEGIPANSTLYFIVELQAVS